MKSLAMLALLGLVSFVNAEEAHGGEHGTELGWFWRAADADASD